MTCRWSKGGAGGQDEDETRRVATVTTEWCTSCHVVLYDELIIYGKGDLHEKNVTMTHVS